MQLNQFQQPKYSHTVCKNDVQQKDVQKHGKYVSIPCNKPTNPVAIVAIAAPTEPAAGPNEPTVSAIVPTPPASEPSTDTIVQPQLGGGKSEDPLNFFLFNFPFTSPLDLVYPWLCHLQKKHRFL